MRQIRWVHWMWVERADITRCRPYLSAAIFRCADGIGDGSCYVYDHEGD